MNEWTSKKRGQPGFGGPCEGGGGCMCACVCVPVPGQVTLEEEHAGLLGGHLNLRRQALSLDVQGAGTRTGRAPKQ